MPAVRVLPMDRTLEASDGSVLRDVLQSAGILLDYPCGGKGTCRQCRVRIEPAPRGATPPDPAAPDTFLACQVRLGEDCVVTVPAERLSTRAWRHGVRDTDLTVTIGSGSLRVVPVEVPAPSLDDQRADWERLGAACGDRGLRMGSADARSLEASSAALRRGAWSVRALVEESDLLGVGAPDDGAFHGIAVDLGTTTVDIALVNLETGALVARRAFLNGQVAFGADVVSRAQSYHDAPEPVRRAAVTTIVDGCGQVLSEAGVEPRRVVKTVIVGNPIMVHILNGIDPYQLTHVPYVPVVSASLRTSPRDMGFPFQGQGFVETLPLISAYVGADTIGMIVSLGLAGERLTTLSIDIGTNGEMVLAVKGGMLATSTAAGPAFEGAEIACGMRALPGAVYGVSIDPSGDLVTAVVGDAAPRGICGTGLIAGIAALLDAGVVDATGRIADPADVGSPALRARLFTVGTEPAVALSNDRAVYITQGDIRKLQLAKGAVRTGIETLLEVSGLSVADLDALRLAGNFGAGLDPAAAMRIGLIPGMDLSRVQVVGNAALRGAILALISRDSARSADSAAATTRFVELGGKPEFQARFMDAMMF